MVPFKALAEAYEAFTQTRLADAARILEELVDQSPYDRNAIRLLHAAYSGLEDGIRLQSLDDKISNHMPWYSDVEFRIATRLLQMGQVEAARERFDRALNMPLSMGPTRMLPFGEVSEARILHDLGYINYMRAEGELSSGPYDECAGQLAEIACQFTEGVKTVRLSAQQLTNIAPIYRRCVHLEDVAVPDEVINRPALNDALARFRAAPDCEKVVWFDGLLTDNAIDELRRYLLKSSIWHNDGQKGLGYLGAYETNGLRHPIMDKLVAEIEHCFYGALGSRKVSQLWCYKNVVGSVGVGVHADFSNVNLNIWLTPTQFNLDHESGGLLVYHAKAPEGWAFEKYNGDHDAIRDIVNGAERSIVTYRENRAMIFDSSLFHASNGVKFENTYQAGRINLTFLFGQR